MRGGIPLQQFCWIPECVLVKQPDSGGAIILLLRFCFIFGYVPTESMEPTLEKGGYILGSGIYGELKTGDIVIFEHEGRLLVKQIAACSGDTILRNDMALMVPPNCFYLPGDNTASSYNLRFWAILMFEKKGLHQNSS